MKEMFAVLTLVMLDLSRAVPLPFQGTRDTNMNGEYLLSSTPGGSGVSKKFPKQYRDYPGGVQYFDLYSPSIETLYSQVFWKGLPPVSLPADVVERYSNGGVMAVVGFELDQVRRTPEGDVSVPINIAYNHHFESDMIGAGEAFEKVYPTGPEDPRLPHHHASMGHGIPSEMWVPAPRGLPESVGAPTKQPFSAANGGEVRKTFHGFPPGYAQIIKSPEQLAITPMQIDTWHRDRMNLTGSPFISGPAPRNSLAPTEGADALYSGLLECPVTTRIRKDIAASYESIPHGRCIETIKSAQECFEGTAKLLGSQAPNQTHSTITGADFPAGCSATIVSESDTIAVTYNTAGGGNCGSNVKHLLGHANSLVSLQVAVDLHESLVNITVVGPADVWFGVGFNASAMRDEPWTIIAEADGTVSERKLVDQSPGTQLPKSISTIANTVKNGERTVVVSRPMQGKTKDYFSFAAGINPEVPFINAVGNSVKLSYHKDKTPSSIMLLPVAGPSVGGVCICESHAAPFGEQKGNLRYVPTTQKGEKGTATSVSFSNQCAPPPRGSLYAQRNPTCDVRNYVGGQLACHHMWSLLDADQEIPWPDQILNYSLKFRFWYQDYNASYHIPVSRGWGSGWDLGAGPGGVGAEYDVPKCGQGIPGCSRAADGTWVHTIMGTFVAQGIPVVAHMHCHAPTCLTMSIYNNKTGKLICEEKAIYGGTGKIDDKRFDEPGFVAVPPCVWGSAEHGLETPPDLTGMTVTVVKTANATYGHHGEMAHGQVFYLDEKLHRKMQSLQVFV